MTIDQLPNSFWQWVADHIADDAVKLRLGAAKWPYPWISEAINQVQRRQRSAKKLPALIANPQSYIPTDLSIEQCTSEALARYHSSLINEGDTVIDLTAGLGIDAMALARRAKSVTAIERDPIVTEALEYNADILGVDNLTVVCADCVEWLHTMASSTDSQPLADVCFIDPARRGDHGQRLYSLADCQPDIVALLPTIHHIARRIIIKMSPMLDISATLRLLPRTHCMIALGTTTECKELIADVGQTEAEPTIEAVTVKHDGTIATFSFTPEEEAAARMRIAMPQPGEHLYIPYPAVMKSGGVRALSERFGLTKPSANTQLFYSPEVIDNFPGEQYEIIEVLPYASSVIKRLNRRYPLAMVSERNMGIPADTLRRKLAIRDGGALRIIGFTSASGSRHLLIAR